MNDPVDLETLLSSPGAGAGRRPRAGRLAPRLADDAVAVCLLTGGLWFAADLTRALARLGRHLAFDALWLASYGDGRESQGRAQVRADLQRPLAGRQALVVDDVVDTGVSLAGPRW